MYIEAFNKNSSELNLKQLIHFDDLIDLMNL